MSLFQKHIKSQISAKTKVYILTRAELLFTLCDEIPWMTKLVMLLEMCLSSMKKDYLHKKEEEQSLLNTSTWNFRLNIKKLSTKQRKHNSLIDYSAQVINAKNCPTTFYYIFQLVWVSMTTTQSIRMCFLSSRKHFFIRVPPLNSFTFPFFKGGNPYEKK